jgi:hypothetical protein
VEVAHVRRDGGHFRQEAPHATQVDDDARQEARASGGQRARERKKNRKESECESGRAKNTKKIKFCE